MSDRYCRKCKGKLLDDGDCPGCRQASGDFDQSLGGVAPDALCQGTGFRNDPVRLKNWLEGRKGELKLIEGCNYFRASYDARWDVALIEGWRLRPLKMARPCWQTIGGEY